MPATGNEATRLSQLKSWWDATIATIYASTIDGNVRSPDAYPQGWRLEEAE